MTSDQIKSAVEHGFADLEALASAIGKADIAAELEKAKAFVENPLVLEVLATAVTIGLGKIGLAEPKPAAPSA